jgi:glutathione S-transferase
MVRRYTLQYVFPRGADNKPDRAVIDGAVKDMKLQLEALDRAYARSDYLAGGQLSIADLLIVPILAYVEDKPEGAKLMADTPNVRRAQKTLRARESFKETQL